MMNKIFLLLVGCSPLFGAIHPHDSLLKRSVEKLFDHPILLNIEDVQINDSRNAVPTGAEPTIVSQRPLGLVNVEWHWYENDKPQSRVTMAKIRGFGSVALASRPIHDGEPFTTENVRFEERELNSIFGSGYYTRLSDLEPLRARGMLTPGTLIRGTQTQTPTWIEPGQSVELTREKANMKVSARVEALQRGKEGNWIRVRNPSTRKVLEAKVVGPGKVALP